MVIAATELIIVLVSFSLFLLLMLSFVDLLFHVDILIVDVVCRMVDKNATKRPSATEALAFPVIAQSLEVLFFTCAK